MKHSILIRCICAGDRKENLLSDNRPSPKMIEEAVCEIMENHSGTLNVLFVEEDALLVFDWDCLNLAVYNPSEKVKSIMEKVAFSEGLFWKKGAN